MIFVQYKDTFIKSALKLNRDINLTSCFTTMRLPLINTTLTKTHKSRPNSRPLSLSTKLLIASQVFNSTFIIYPYI